jgi:hypothetical protein
MKKQRSVASASPTKKSIVNDSGAVSDVTPSNVEMEHLRGEISLRQAKIDVNRDLER